VICGFRQRYGDLEAELHAARWVMWRNVSIFSRRPCANQQAERRPELEAAEKMIGTPARCRSRFRSLLQT